MAPLALQQIAENLTQDEPKVSFEDMKARAKMKAAGCFLVGLSAGAAVAVRFQHLMPGLIRNYFTLPSLFGVGSAAAAHHHSMKGSSALATVTTPRRQVPASLRKTKPLSLIVDFYGIQIQFHKT